MQTILITGGNGFIGRRVLERLAQSGEYTVFALIRQRSTHDFASFLSRVDGGDRVFTVNGDIAEPGLGLDPTALPQQLDHVLHLAAIYDMDASAAAQHRVNIEGTRNVVELAHTAGATMHHVSSIAVSGDHRGRYTETDFDLGQPLPTPYHQTKFEAEMTVRERTDLTWRIYRPAIVVGDATSGRIDKVDGPYYFFESLTLLSVLPSWLPVPFPNLGKTNIVPVDFVADSICALLPADPDKQHAVYHLSDPNPPSITDMYNALSPSFGGPRAFNALPNGLVQPLVLRSRKGRLRTARDAVARGRNIPPAVLDAVSFSADFRADATSRTLADLGVTLPAFPDYAPMIWSYWRDRLDTRANRQPSADGPLVGRNILITGGSSGIGKATAAMCVARGANVSISARDPAHLTSTVTELLAVAPKPGITRGEVRAYPCDVADEKACRELVARIVAEQGHVDVLVNNAGHSIRREAFNSVDRAHDYRRLMDVNYFGTVNLTLALLPHMRRRQAGHIVNVTSVAVQAHGPRFSAYTASKSAIEAFSDVVAVETRSSHITFSNVRLPLTKTPMIAPTNSYKRLPGVWSTEKSAARVLHAITDRPATVNTAQGNLIGFARHAFPKTTGRAMTATYLMGADSRAARGERSSATHDFRR
ncbi:SDR family oxidoreductase [Gordonia sp. HY285]|uniref:SDR family oxidoreductase n=1 Tax=Gordonia liuliyuniae TaxID=2911517 RepID=UPI001F028B89|nr:SDR family oxidoreductase [Gordonia liuliyuniae]MCF8609207.1 SDR family oxidoreductase [Gordonia liuliyuniae]